MEKLIANETMTHCKNIFSFCLIICLNIQLLRAQLSFDSLPSFDSLLLQQLEVELFPDNPEWVPIKEYPGCNIYEFIMDSALLVRRIQPDYIKVQVLLEQIAYSGDYDYFEPLMSLYQRHQENFKLEWQFIHSKNKHYCDIRIDQATIMFAFENTLRALEWAKEKYTSDMIWKEYQKERELRYRLLYRDGASYFELSSQYEYYSEYFREVRRMQGSWSAYPVSFMPYTIYLDSILSFIIEEIRVLNPSILYNNDVEDEERRAAFYFNMNMQIMYYVHSPELEKILMAKYDTFVRQNKSIDIHEYLWKNKDISMEFVHFLIDYRFTSDFLRKESIEIKQFWLSGITVQHTKLYVKEYLMEKLQSPDPDQQELALIGLGNFPETEVLNMMLVKAKRKKSSASEKEIILHNLKRFELLYQKLFDEKELKLIKRKIKDLMP